MNGDTSLIFASKRSQLNVVERLLPLAGAKGVNAVNRAGETALILAVRRGLPDIVNALLPVAGEEGVNYVDPQGETALIYAAKRNRPIIFKALLPYSLDFTRAAREGDLAVINTLLPFMDAGDVNKVNQYGDNALMYAAHYEHLDVVTAILEAPGAGRFYEKDLTPRIRNKYSLSHPAFCRFISIPAFTVLSCFRKFNDILLSNDKFSGKCAAFAF